MDHNCSFLCTALYRFVNEFGLRVLCQSRQSVLQKVDGQSLNFRRWLHHHHDRPVVHVAEADGNRLKVMAKEVWHVGVVYIIRKERIYWHRDIIWVEWLDTKNWGSCSVQHGCHSRYTCKQSGTSLAASFYTGLKRRYIQVFWDMTCRLENMAVRWLRRAVAPEYRIVSQVSQCGICSRQMALKQVFLSVLRFSHVSIIQSMLHINETITDAISPDHLPVSLNNYLSK